MSPSDKKRCVIRPFVKRSKPQQIFFLFRHKFLVEVVSDLKMKVLTCAFASLLPDGERRCKYRNMFYDVSF
jgi:hypothetical protein